MLGAGGGVALYYSADYRSPDQAPDGAVLVVGSAQSGCQITEDLLAGRRVVLATRPVGRVPFRHRGARASTGWSRPASWTNDHMTCRPIGDARRHADPRPRPRPEPAGAGPGRRHTGRRPVAVAGERVAFDSSLATNVAAGEAFATRIRAMVDEIIGRRGLDAPPAEADDHDAPVAPPAAWTSVVAMPDHRHSWCCSLR
jgi:putative flavoprotein involved in K+ transport